MLKYVLEALESGKIEDCWLCPISLQYDKVIETESYVNELLGNPKEKERKVVTSLPLVEASQANLDFLSASPVSAVCC